MVANPTLLGPNPVLVHVDLLLGQGLSCALACIALCQAWVVLIRADGWGDVPFGGGDQPRL